MAIIMSISSFATSITSMGTYTTVYNIFPLLYTKLIQQLISQVIGISIIFAIITNVLL